MTDLSDIQVKDARGRIFDEIRTIFRKEKSGRRLTGLLTGRIDSLLSGIFSSAGGTDGVVLIATGGYGRGEMAPFSDIDIMVFAPDKSQAGLAERIFYSLWDTGLEISHSFRTAEETIEEAFKDIKTRTSLLETRYVAGDKELYDSFRKKVYPEIAFRRQKEFVREKLQEMEKRHQGTGDSVYLLEPHIKEGEGGLRDFHTAYWLAKVALKIDTPSDFFGLLGAYDLRRFLGAYDFLLRTRFGLHLESNRRNDILSFEFQRSVAAGLGFRDSQKFSASERMLRYYYLKSRVMQEISRQILIACSKSYVKTFRSFFVRKITEEFSLSGGKLIMSKEGLLRRNPAKVIECFYLFSKTGKKFSEALKENIKSNLVRLDGRVRNSPEAVRYFLEILKSDRVYETLREMHETGVLGRFLPEFGALSLLVVHEPYHMYTVDEHTLIAIRNLERLRTTTYKKLEELGSVLKKTADIECLYMAILFHDIGKAVGRHHEEEGYKRLKGIMERFNLDRAKRIKIELLVRNHVRMSMTALKREASDIEVITRFADAVGDRETLDALYLITYADMSAVNPDFWTSWRAYLLKDLYLHTAEYLSGLREDGEEHISGLLSLVSEKDVPAFESFIREMPGRYILSTSKRKVMDDFRLVENVKKESFDMRIDIGPDGIAELSVSAEDCPGLFSRIVGFLSSKGLNIVEGRLFTGKNGIVIDKASVSNWKEIWWDGLSGDLEEGLRKIIVHDMPVNVVRREKKAEVPFGVFIELDNEASDEFSLLEVFSPDRMGLLYDISDVMFKAGINIVSARINTDGGLVHDVFYVQSGKSKLTGESALETLSEIWAVLK